MKLPAKKRCRICRKAFRPDPRTEKTQRACGKEDCQRKRRARTQARWRNRNPDYQIAYRLKIRAVVAAAAKKARERGEPACSQEPLWVPAPLRSIPWDLAMDELGVAGSDLLAVLAVLLVRYAKDVMREETSLFMRTYKARGDPGTKNV